MERIYKYPIRVEDKVEVEAPSGAEVLCVQMQNGIPCIWMKVDPEAPKRTLKFRIYGTGQNLPEHTGRYIGTFQLLGGTLVFHLFQP